MSETAVFHISGMHCASCVSRVERAIEDVPGVRRAAVNLTNGQAHVTFAGAAEHAPLVDAVRSIGFGVQAPEPGQQEFEAEALRRRALLAIALALPVLVLEMGGHLVPSIHHWIAATIGLGTSAWLQFVLTGASLAGPGRPLITSGLKALARRAPEMNALVALGTGAAFFYSTLVLVAPGVIPDASRAIYFESAAIIIAFILIGRWLEARAKGQAGAAVAAMLALRPDTALVLREGGASEVPVAEIAVGDHVLARPGDRIAVDGHVIDGMSHVEEAMITGEPLPVEKRSGDAVIGGTINSSGALTYRATAVGEATYLAEMARIVAEAQARKLPIQRLLDRITAVFVPVVIAIAVLAMLAWLGFGGTLSQALTAGVSVLIIACPCAMGLATPASIMVGMGRAAELGVIFRRADALQVLDRVNLVAFDKTGTLTEGKMSVHEVTGKSDEVLRLAAAVETRSEHPIARAIVATARARGLAIPEEVAGFTAHAGQGALARVEGQEVRVGTEEFTGASEVPDNGRTVVYVSMDGAYLGSIILADGIKPNARDAVDKLKERQLTSVLVTGDAEGAARPVADALGIEEVYARVRPEEKKAVIAELRTERSVAFVGDGINDAPALAEADVGLAIGTGTDIAIETADVVLQSGDPVGVVRAKAISQATMRNIRQNLAWAFGYNVLLIPVAAGVLYPVFGLLLSPALAGLAMALSSVAVVTNALRLKRVAL